ncbi:helix-turn-helix domain-containing protein [Nocardia testacea]
MIAVSLGRSPSTISREIARNGGRRAYRAAGQLAYQRARRPKPARLAACPPVRALVEDKLKSLWSPEQIAGWLRRHFPDDPAMRISHEAIYLALFDPRRKALARGDDSNRAPGLEGRREPLGDSTGVTEAADGNGRAGGSQRLGDRRSVGRWQYEPWDRLAGE